MTITAPSTLVLPLIAAAGDPVPPTGFYAKHGLLVTGSPGGQTRWEMDGVHFQSRLCAAYHAYEIERCMDLDEVNSDTPETCPGIVDFIPLRVEMSVENGPLRVDNAEWLPERLSLGLSQKVEALVWDGGTGVGLKDGTALTSPTAGGPEAMLGAVEDKILTAQAGAGTIHMAPSMALPLLESAVYEDGTTLRTRATGSKVVVGNYPVNKMAAHIGNIDVYLGEQIYQDEYFDRAVNLYYTRATINAAAAWNTCAAWTYSYV